MAKKAMTSVRMLMSRSGPDVNDVKGDVIAVPADEAKRMVAAGQCELVGRQKRTATKSKAGAKETRG